MARFFVDRPIVAMVISIIMVIVGLVSMLGLPIAQYPDIVPPEVLISGTYIGADALTVEQSVATPIEQQMSGVDNMNYMNSISSSDGRMSLRVNFAVGTDPNTDQVLAQMRQSQAESQLPAEVREYGVTVTKSTASPLMVIALTSPDGAYDETFLANYAYINLNDQLLRVPGISQVTIFGAGQYSMRLWVNPDTLARLNITVPEIIAAVQAQNTVNPAGRIGDEPVPAGQDFTYTVRAKGRLTTPEEFEQIVVRANPDGSIVRIKDVARAELGAQVYNLKGRLDGQPAAAIAVYQLPGSNAIQAADGVRRLMAEQAERFPPGLEFVLALDTTLPITEGIDEIVQTLFEAMLLVLIVVFIFLQSFRATLIPMVAVPVSLIGTFAVFPLLGFTINTLSLLGLVLAIGIVVDDAIVVVEAVEHHISQGMSSRDATLQAMREVTGPVVVTSLIMVAVFVPTVFIPGITGRLYQQFAVTIAVSVVISSINALTLSPALSALLLRPRKEMRGPLGWFFRKFNAAFGKATHGYVGLSAGLIRKDFLGLVILGLVVAGAWLAGRDIPTGFLPEEDQGYFFVNVSLPPGSSLQRTDAVCRQVEEILAKTPGVAYTTTIVGYSMLSQVYSTYSGFYFVTLKEWAERSAPEEQYKAILTHVNTALAALPEANAMAFSPPAIPGIGTSGGVTFMLEDRSGQDIEFLAANTAKFVQAAQQRQEIASAVSMFQPAVPQVYVDVDRDKALMQGLDLGEVYKTVQAFMGGAMVNYFNRFGRQWQVYVQAEGEFRTSAENLGQFYVRNAEGDAVPLSAITTTQPVAGPEYTTRFNLYRCAQINAASRPGVSSIQAMAALEDVFRQTMPPEMGFDYMGMSYQEKQAREGVPASAIFLLSLLFVFLLLAAQYDSWSLPFSVLLGTPIAVFGAFAALWLRGLESNVYAQIGLVMLIALAAKNAILIVEFAKLEHEQGKPLIEAALGAARLRLRPILMTSFAFILGCIPLWTAAGAGALSRRVIGTDVVGGMLAATLLGVFLVPMLYVLVQGLSERVGRKKDKPGK
ncbi:hydrophobe/amphiphile efflux-1 (HAE1) family transporter [Desulfocurvibacter africanus PCS]|uniref:Hydrophobe/amphiphile efflux-1 (HAE1) family transporter n=1 Tax=Desulfocurvibacter africanus PCS TaxID=1262666 RepID=M5PR80_DESAF|nr:multidrug efflux RND transporter permease subunit [Desulfocurvibacter africanus]EMG36897.1 hydrophobe/amphiphile efflux-1 (HAE1) family transporter [Desulfocurvibacter africanus PCS]